MEGNKSIQRSDEQRNLYKASTTGSQSRQLSASEFAFAEEPVQTTCQMEEPSHPVFETGADDQLIFQTSQHPEWFSLPKRPPSPDRDWNKTLSSTQGDAQSWISKLARQTDARSSFNELLDTPINFSNFIINRLGVATLTPKLLAGPTYELMRGSCNSLTELEYHLEEVYKATTDQLDWVNPEGQQYPHNLLQSLPLIPDNRGRRVIPFEHFINNDLEYLWGGASSRKYTKSITKTKAADYGHIKWIEDLVPRAMWIQEPINYDRHALWGVSHWGRKRDFKRLRLQDIEDMLLLLVQGKLSNLTVEECFAFNVSLRMFTRSIVIQRRVEDLGVESYQKRLNLTKPDTYQPDLKRREAYTAYSNPKGFIYQNKDKKNRLMRIDELHKFSDGTLNDVRNALDDRLKGIRMQYLPTTIWRRGDKDRAVAMIQAIDMTLKTRRIMRSLEKFVGGRLVLFTDTECLVLSSNFKLPDASQVLLRFPRENNMYNVNLRNIVPSGDLTCLFANTTLDESNLWHRRLGHVNFKTINKLVKGNLVRGLPTKVFTNDNSCVACKKGKQHRASYNLLSLKVKVIRCDNGTEFKNSDLNQFCGLKGIKREFSAEAVNTACYVQNRLLVTKPHNKTPYELLHGRLPSIGFMRPFGYRITILNTLDHLGKFQGNVDEGFLIGYSVCSKAFRVFNSRTRTVQETLHVNFMENKPNVAGSGPAWLFDIDSLTRIMNYHPVITENQTNSHAGFQDTEKAKVEGTHTYVLFLVLFDGSTNSQNNNKDALVDGKEHDDDIQKSVSPDIHSSSSGAQTRKQGDMTENKDKGKSYVVTITEFRDFNAEFEEYTNNSSNRVNAASSSISTAGHNYINSTNDFSAVGPSNAAASPTTVNSSDMPNLEDLTHSDDADDIGAEADINNLESIISVSPIPTTRIHKDHPTSQIIVLLLLIPFWAEAVNTACYVQNRVLVTKPHNKTPYELLHGRLPSIGFMRPFGCLVTILNTLDPLAKFQRKETLHVNFMENKPNVAGSSPVWDLNEEFEECINNSSNEVNAAGSSVSAAGLNFINSTNDFSAAGPSNADMPNLEDLSHNADDVGAEADINNLESIISVSPIPTTRIHKDHPTSQIIGDLSLTTQTRSMARVVRDQGRISQMFNEDFHACMFACFLSQEEPKRVHQALKDPSRIEAIQEELL
nr:ribonuclease H-like domain-containing protein [Tanacetum cinerariifolium]